MTKLWTVLFTASLAALLELFAALAARSRWLSAVYERFAMRVPYLILMLAVSAPVAVGAPITLQNATATFTQGGFFVSQTIDGNLGGTGVVNGWAIAELIIPQTAVYETQTDVGGPGGATLTFTLTQNYGSSITLGLFRLSATADDRSSFADGLNTGGDVTANWMAMVPVAALATNGATLTIRGDLSILAGGANPATTVYTVTAFTDVTRITGIRLQTLEDPSLPANGPGRAGNGNFVLQEFHVDAVDVAAPNADFDEDGVVDGADLARWRTNFGTGATHMQGNANATQDVDVDGTDFLVWQRQLGGVSAMSTSAAVPEPGPSAVLLAAGGLLLAAKRAVGVVTSDPPAPFLPFLTT